ncbi:MAG: hypothetical protein AVDCRST_MAG73-2321, partial [uncultured Thermomicrobiales bacterium]
SSASARAWNGRGAPVPCRRPRPTPGFVGCGTPTKPASSSAPCAGSSSRGANP